MRKQGCAHGPAQCKHLICLRKKKILEQALDQIRILACENNWESLVKIAERGLKEGSGA